MAELFVIGTFWFWALVAAEIVLLFVFMNYDNGLGAIISLCSFAAMLQWFGDVDFIAYTKGHPWYVLSFLIGYLALGVVWGVTRWYFFCLDRRRTYDILKADFLEEHNVPAGTKVVPDEFKEDWKTFLINKSDKYGKLSDRPKAKDHKSRITSWMAFWVISMVWFFMKDFLKRVFTEIYLHLAGFLQRISDNLWANVDQDLPTASPPLIRKDRKDRSDGVRDRDWDR